MNIVAFCFYLACGELTIVNLFKRMIINNLADKSPIITHHFNLVTT